MQGSNGKLDSCCFKADPLASARPSEAKPPGILENYMYIYVLCLNDFLLRTWIDSTPSLVIEATRQCIRSGWLLSSSLKSVKVEIIKCVYETLYVASYEKLVMVARENPIVPGSFVSLMAALASLCHK